MSSDPLLAPLRTLLNRQIERSTAARQAVTDLEGRTLAIQIRNTALTLYITVYNAQIELSRQYSQDPDAILDTTPVGLAQLARGQAGGGSIAFSGDPVVAQQFEQLLRHTRPDWEEELSRIVGDVAAHQVGNTLRSLFSFGQRAVQSLSRNSADYFQEERRDLPTRAEVDGFNRRVGDIAEAVAKLQRDIDQLTRRDK